MPFNRNVFINCPFDEDYKPLLKSLVFTLLYLEFEPRISQTKSSSTIRIDQILNHIQKSMYGIHNLSRSRPLKKNEFPRFNMPYELGLDVGCVKFGNRQFKKKRLLILEKERFHYQKVISDISGQDIESHNDDPRTLIRKVRNWFSLNDGRRVLPPPTEIWNVYNQYCLSLDKSLVEKGYSEADIEEMPIEEFIKLARGWILSFKK